MSDSDSREAMTRAAREAHETPREATPDVETLTFQVGEAEAGERLDTYLAARIEGTSRTSLKRMIEDGDVLIDGRIVGKASSKLRAGAMIEVELTEPPALALAPENIPLDIVYEDDDMVVVNKPAGMVVHPAAGVHGGTLANALAYHFQQLPAARGGALRPGLVHRLDRDTSGLVMVAKNSAAHEALTNQFRARTVFKSYIALVHGLVAGESQDANRIDQPIARDPRQRTRMAVVRGGRESLTLYRVRRRYTRFTLLDVEIKTGRTHQIRVHLAWLKHPVVADEVYGAGRDRNLSDPVLRTAIARLGRQFLHAAHLGFQHPRTGEPMRFAAPLPAALAGFLEVLETM